MDKLRAMELFIRLAELGSFTAVGDELNSSKSLISKEISRLEAAVGVRLIQRSTRNLQLTQSGQEYLLRCREIVAKVQEADAWIQDAQEQARGRLRINAPMALGLTDLSTMFADFMAAYPQIELDIHLGDESMDLIEHGFDVGFRATSTVLDSTYVGRPLTTFSYHICASPEYLKNHEKITKASDLTKHNCFFYSYFQNKNVWPIGKGVAIQGNLKVNSTIFMLEAVKRGQGVGFIPDFVCKSALQTGDIREVLPNTKKPSLTLYVLYPARQYMPLKLQHCISFMDRWFNTKPRA